MKNYPITLRDKSGPDRRYSVSAEYCGHDKPRHVARFCGEWIGSAGSYQAAALLLAGHRSVREGKEIVTEQTVAD